MTRAGTRDPFFDVRMRGFRDRTEVSQVLRMLEERLRSLQSEVIPLSNLAGRVLVDPIDARVNVPVFVRAAMDGFALRAEDTFGADSSNPLQFTIVGASFPARPFAQQITTGQAVRIMTGAPMPDGADAVLPFEHSETVDSTRLFVREAVPPGRNVGKIGEDVAAGQQVLAAGRRLRPQDIGLISALGVESATVVRQPRVSILLTGDELLPPGSRSQGYQIVDSNSLMLSALVARDGGISQPARYLKDDYESIRATIHGCTSDVILVSGGSSVGEEDHAPRVIAELGELAVHGIALRPASPTGIGFLPGNRVVFLLPGNPVSCLCAYDLFAGRAIRRLGGRPMELPYRTKVMAVASKIVSAVGRMDYVRVCLSPAGVIPVAVSGAGLLSTTVVADGFVLVPCNREGYGPGESVEVQLYD